MAAVLEARALRVTAGGATLLDAISLVLQPGECLAVMGPNGAGKTTLVDVLSGFRRPAAGRVVLAGDDVTRLAPEEIARRGLVRTFQQPDLPGDWRVAELLHLAAEVAAQRSLLAGWGRGEDVGAVLEGCGLAAMAQCRIRDLSLAARKRADLARAWMQQPRCLLADEPAAGLAPGEMAGVGEVLAAMCRSGTSILLVEHRLSLVQQVASRVVRLERGRLQEPQRAA